MTVLSSEADSCFLQKTNQAPNPLSHPLGLTPSTAEDIFHIGKSQDLGQCEATKRDGNRCDDWIDK